MRNRRTLLLTSSTIVAVGMVTVAWAVPQQAQEAVKAKAKVGEAAPTFTLLDCEGKKHNLEDLKDKIVVLEWMNQQCPWCIKALPICKKIKEKYAEKGVVWLGIESTHWRKPSENIKFKRDKGIEYPILMDTDGKVGRAYGARTTPHMFVINKGTLVYAGALNNNQHGRKSTDEARDYVDEALATVLADKDVPVAETTPWGCSVKYAKQK